MWSLSAASVVVVFVDVLVPCGPVCLSVCSLLVSALQYCFSGTAAGAANTSMLWLSDSALSLPPFSSLLLQSSFQIRHSFSVSRIVAIAAAAASDRDIRASFLGHAIDSNRIALRGLSFVCRWGAWLRPFLNGQGCAESEVGS